MDELPHRWADAGRFVLLLNVLADIIFPWRRLRRAEPSPHPRARRERGLLAAELRRESDLTFRSAVSKSLPVPATQPPGLSARGDGGSMTAADHVATGGSNAVRVSADAKNVSAIVQSARTASCMQTPIERRESCVVVLTPLAEHRSCHHLKSKSYIDIALYCIKYCTFVVLHDGTLHAHGAMQNRVSAGTLAGTIAGIAALPACTTIRLEDLHRASRADARGRARPQFLAVSRCAPSTAAGGREQIGSP